MVSERFDAIVVGAGPAGTSAALAMARKGLNVLLIERGEYPGAKNMFGGLIYRWPLEEIVPKFWEKAPIERFVTEHRYLILSGGSGLTFSFKDLKWGTPPYNSFSVLRANFDKWYASQAEEAGVLLATSSTVTDLIWDEKQVVGVRAGERSGNEVYGDVIVAADGVNSRLGVKAGLRKVCTPQNVALGVKEIFELPSETIESRFNLQRNQGTALLALGVTRGMMGGGFIYTNRQSLSVGLVIPLDHLMKLKIEAYQLLDEFEAHPIIAPLIDGGRAKEYSAHLIPESGYYGIPQLFTDGFLLAGDAAFLCDVQYFEGTNMAMLSGLLAAETVIEAKKKGDFTTRTLSRYSERLNSSYAVKELYRRRNVPKFLGGNPRLFGTYPEVLNRAIGELLSMDGKPKETKRKAVLKDIRKRVGYLRLIRDVLGSRSMLP